ncbi:hypothetical protein D3C81_1318190 [compost metagenome]
MNAAATEVVVALMRGTTETWRSCVSRSRLAVPVIDAIIWLLLSWNSSILPTPFSIVPLPVRSSNTTPRLDRLRKSSVANFSRLCRLSTPSRRAAPGSTLRIWPFSSFSESRPDSDG